MTEAARQAKLEYHRNWRKANQDKVKEYNCRYWERKAQAAESTEEHTEPDRKDGDSLCG